ncbi:MAG TPA: hypothetical protein VFK69_06605 [Candidatus Eisenbacteria bacterium]|nr:hypothetical protein [Candidatus Eisenbacteria bacterium]
MRSNPDPSPSSPSLLDTVLLLALPASGKSEIRRYLGTLTPEQCRTDMHMGPVVQLDDYPYVDLMRRVSRALRAQGENGVFFDSDLLPMKEPLDWGALIELLNEDYAAVLERSRVSPESAGAWMLGRFDWARAQVGAKPAFHDLSPRVRERLIAEIEPACRELVEHRNATIPGSLRGRTVVIEFARGGPEGATMPLQPPVGYGYSLSRLSDDILAGASILYVWVTPEESRRKNEARSPGAADDSVLHHTVPPKVMRGDYGCDDIAWLIERSDRPDTVKLQVRGRTHHLPIARFDNRVDRTSFVRDEQAAWPPEQVRALHDGLSEAFGRLVRARDASALAPKPA